MNVEELHLVLQQSFSADAAVRNPAETTIRNLKYIPGAVPALLRVASELQVRFEVRQAAAIQIKNICRECWTPRQGFPYSLVSDGETAGESIEEVSPAPSATTANTEEQQGSLSLQQQFPILSDADKAEIKASLIRALLDEPEKSVRDLFAECLHTMVVHEFPDKWPDLVPTLLTTIREGILAMEQPELKHKAGLQVHNALLSLRKVCKRYEYKSKDQRGPLNDIVQASFPMLLPLGQQLVHQNSIESAMMLKQILKIFWSSTQFYLPGRDPGNSNDGDPTNGGSTGSSSIGLARPDMLQPWFDVLTAALKKPLPEAEQPADLEARNAWPWWKVKKWAVQVMSRMFSRYGFVSYADDEPAKEFARYFSTVVAPQFLGPVCETLNIRTLGQFCTDRVVHLCLTFVTSAVELSATYKLLKPHLDFLLYQVCFPVLCLSPSDVECFENDPVEFVHKQNSPLADFYDPRLSAITLVKDLVKQRGQDVTQNLLARMTEILHRYNSSPVEQKNHIEKDGALLTFGSLSKPLLATPKYATQIEGLLLTSVFPDFTSPIGFLRYRACWMVQQFAAVKWTDDGTHLKKLLQKVLERLSDPALPVQIEASKALRFLIETDGADEALLPVLPQLLTEYFRIMNEIGNDEVVSALQVLLEKFGEHIEPHAVQLVTQLSQAFDQYCRAGDDQDDDDAALAAAQCLECIATVLKGVCSQESMLKRLEPLLLPLVLKILGDDGDFIEYLECALDILTFLTYFQSQISMELWQCFPLIYVAFDQWAYDYLNMMVPCLQSYISKSPQIFLTGTAQLPEGPIPYVELIISMVSKTLTNDRASEMECRYALSLFMSILHNCIGKVDSYLPFFNELALGKLGQQISAPQALTRISVYQVLGSALYYNPQLELVELERRAVTGQVFSKWLQDIEHMEKWLPKKMAVLGITSIFKLPTQALPQSIVAILPQLLHTAVRLASAMKEESAKTPKGGDDDDDGLDEDEDDGAAVLGDDDVGDLDHGFGEDEDVKNEADEAYRKALQGSSGWDDDMAKFLMGDWDEDAEDVDEEYESPLDVIDEIIFVNDTLKHAFHQEPMAYQQIQNALPPLSVQAVQRLFLVADSIRAQASQQATQES
ncbi:hypothetical protein ACA910_002972 [Epithemia clementina (nom. ined.)]